MPWKTSIRNTRAIKIYLCLIEISDYIIGIDKVLMSLTYTIMTILRHILFKHRNRETEIVSTDWSKTQPEWLQNPLTQATLTTDQ